MVVHKKTALIYGALTTADIHFQPSIWLVLIVSPCPIYGPLRFYISKF